MVLIFPNLEVRFSQIKHLVKKVFVDVLTNFYQCDTARVLWEEAIQRKKYFYQNGLESDLSSVSLINGGHGRPSPSWAVPPLDR